MIKLSRPINYGSNKLTYARPVCLPDKEFLKYENVERYLSSKRCIISGWGNVHKSQNSISDVLLKAHAEITPNKECQTLISNLVNINGQQTGVYYNNLRKEQKVENLDTIVCAKEPTEFSKSTDTCQGDSGGPLVCQVKNTLNLTTAEKESLNISDKQDDHKQKGRYVLTALTSFGTFPCGEGPAVYTKVASYIDWIYDSITDGGSNLSQTFQVINPNGSITVMNYQKNKKYIKNKAIDISDSFITDKIVKEHEGLVIDAKAANSFLRKRLEHTSCDAGYHLSEHLCKQNVCKCVNGMKSIGRQCESHGLHRCSDCDPGFRYSWYLRRRCVTENEYNQEMRDEELNEYYGGD